MICAKFQGLGNERCWESCQQGILGCAQVVIQLDKIVNATVNHRLVVRLRFSFEGNNMTAATAAGRRSRL